MFQIAKQWYHRQWHYQTHDQMIVERLHWIV